MATSSLNICAEVLAESVVNPSTALRTIGFILSKNGLKFLDSEIGWFRESI